VATVTPHSDLRQRYFLFTIISVLWVVADQFSKLWIRNNMEIGSTRHILGIISFSYLTNTGGVFGLFTGHVNIFAISSSIIIVALIIFHRYLKVNHPWPNFAFGLIMGGAIGNLIDRVYFGQVTDFIDIRLWFSYHWAPFNLADSGVVVGTILIVIMVLVNGKLPSRN
jgi:signal peptidase II